MKYQALLLFLLTLSLGFKNTHAQSVMLNGNFSKIDPPAGLPEAWNNFIGDDNNYIFGIDSPVMNQGKHALTIASKNDAAAFGAIYCVIPYAFTGKRIQLKGYLRTENVTGFAGFWLRIDGTRAFENMHRQNIHGTTRWKEYTIDLPYDDGSAININAGALLMGKGKAWMSDVRVYIDGTPIEDLKPKPERTYPAQSDTAFSTRSGIADFNPSEQQVKDMALLCQVWGFIKYHLAKVKAGQVNMDAELFRMMPAVLQARDYAETSNVMERWMDKLGAPMPCADCKPFDKGDVAEMPGYGEIFNPSIVSASLISKLDYILKNNKPGSSYYIGMERAGNPDFTNEKADYTAEYPDAGYRLLTLFRYWNMIQYFYPDKHLIGEDWGLVLSRMIPQFLLDRNAADFDGTAMALIAGIHDTHAGIWSRPTGLAEFRGRFSPPFQAKFIEDKLVVTGYYDDVLDVKSHVKIGDVITGINGVKLDELVRKYLPYTAASNYETQLRDMPRNYLLRSNDSIFTLDMVRDDQPVRVKQTGLPVNDISYGALSDNAHGPSFHLMANGQIGFVYPGRYYNKDLSEIKKAFKDTKGIIVDMRCYPSEFMPFTFGAYIKSGKAKFVKFTFCNTDNPGLFRMGKPIEVPPAGEYKGKVVVIVNEQTQSQAEYTTMAFQSSPNVIVIGSKTAGADGNVSTIMLPGGIMTWISGLGVLYPDGTETQRAGVKIDEIVKPTIPGLKAGRDELMERAQAIILGK